MFFCRYVYFTNFINYKTKPNLDLPCGVDMYASARFFYCRYIVIVQALSAITVGWTSACLSFFNRTEAQEIKDVKETLVVDYFMRSPNVPVAYADAIRRGGNSRICGTRQT